MKSYQDKEELHLALICKLSVSVNSLRARIRKTLRSGDVSIEAIEELAYLERKYREEGAMLDALKMDFQKKYSKSGTNPGTPNILLEQEKRYVSKQDI